MRAETQELVEVDPTISVALLDVPTIDQYWPIISEELKKIPHCWADNWTLSSLYIAAPVLIAFKLRPDSKDAEDEKDEKSGNAIGGKPAV